MSNSEQFPREDLGDIFKNAFNTATYASHGSSGDGQKRHNSKHDARMVTSPKSIDQIEDDDSGKDDVGNANDEPKLNVRSCVTCRARKVRCDKHEPCSNCVKANHACVFPPPGRARRKPKRPHDTELLKRLRRLESVVDSLGSRVDEDGNVHSNDKANDNERSTSLSDTTHGFADPVTSRRSTMEQRLGSLVIKEGRSRYIADDFWQALGTEIAEIRNVMDEPSSEDEDGNPDEVCPNAPDGSYSSHQEFLLGYSSTLLDMRKLHPTPTQTWILWEIFKENIDPVTKILHIPTVRNVIMKAAVSASSLDRPNEALFFSMCFAAIVSMNDDQCQQLIGSEKKMLVRRYRFAVEQTFARASFLNSNNFLVLQALVLYVTTVKLVDGSRSIWMLTSISLQLARTQGLHRDGTNFPGLSPYDVEMRRRLWWHISSQDIRGAEDHGSIPMQLACDTKLPLNVNDDDIWPGMSETPIDRRGHTDVSFCLLRFEMGIAMRKVRNQSLGENDTEACETVEAKEHLIETVQEHLKAKYFVDYDPNSSIMVATSIVAKLIMAKLWLMIHHPRLMLPAGDAEAQKLKDRIFLKSVEVIELAVVIMFGKDTEKWSWLFKTYMQWHSVAYVLNDLITKPLGPEYERGWRAIDDIYRSSLMRSRLHGKGSSLWRPLRALYDKANMRRKEVAGPAMQIPTPPDAFEANVSPSTNSPDSAQQAQQFFFTDGFLNANPYNQMQLTMRNELDMDFNDFPLNAFGPGAFCGLDTTMANNAMMAGVNQPVAQNGISMGDWSTTMNGCPNGSVGSWPNDQQNWQWPGEFAN